MAWLLLLLVPIALAGLAIYFERSRKRQAKEHGLSVKDHETLEEDYISHGAGNESVKPENL